MKIRFVSTMLACLLLASISMLWSDDRPVPKFKQADKNGDGKVTLEELKAVSPAPKQSAKVFKKLDKDSNGSLTPEELARALNKAAKAEKASNIETEKSADSKATAKDSPSTADAATAARASDFRSSGRNVKQAAAAIDQEIDKALQKNKVLPSARASDGEFIRRLSLDLRGRIPTFSETEKFLQDRDSDKRAKLIDEFLADDEFGEHFAIIWYHRIAKPDDDNKQALLSNQLQEWLADAFNKNRGWDGIVNDLVTATGSRDQNPATTLWLAAVNDAKLGQPEPAKATGAVSRLFMGVRLECCECHDHPFTTLKQGDFWGTAAFFAQTHARDANQAAAKVNSVAAVFEKADFAPRRKKKNDTADKGPVAPFGSVTIPYAEGKTVEVKYLGGDSPDYEGESKLRPLFANWLTSPKNPYFARAGANKLWANFFGRGIVNPIDDMQTESTNTHPELLALLADEFAQSNFDQKHLIRCICNSQTYQRTSAPTEENKSDDMLYSKMPLKVMTADMLYDSLQVALGHTVAAKERTGGKMAANAKKRRGGPREEFRKFFHAEADDDAGVVADYTHGVPQVLRMMNSRQINDTTSTVQTLMSLGNQPDKVIRGLYLTALSREPDPKELQLARKFVIETRDAAEGYGDLMWALLNTGEFVFNH